MSAIHVVVRPNQSSPTALESLSGLFDVVVDGVNVTARVGQAHALCVLGELALAIGGLISGRIERASVELYADQELWELGLEADQDDVLITVFRSGPSPEVAVHERRVELVALRDAVETALSEAGLTAAVDALRNCAAVPRTPLARAARRISPRPAAGIGLSACAELRQRPAQSAPESERHLERADLHALLCLGEASLTIRGRSASLGNVHLFLLAERLLALADDALEAWQLGRALFRRIELGGTRVVLQRGPGEGPLSLSVAVPGSNGERLTFPEIDPGAFVRATVRFARALSDAITEGDPTQAKNLRLTTLLSHAAALAERAEDAKLDDSVTNSEPDSYRSYSRRPKKSESRGRWEHGGKMRFVPRWVATVPSIDLRATFLCGDRLIIGSERETACIHRAAGALLWRVPTARAACVATPLGLARLAPDGRLTLLDLEDGQVRFTTLLTPRMGGGATGSVVHMPGLPKLLVIAEGDRHVTAVDLVTGEVRWRHRFKTAGIQRMRRNGKLLLVSADTVLVALDVATGAVVWRIRHRLPFSGDLALDHDSAFATVGGTNGAQLVHFDPWSGTVRATVALGERPAPGQPPLVMPDVVAVPVRDRRGMGLCAFSRSTLEPLWWLAPGLSSPTTAWLAVDGDVVGNSAAGTLLAIDGRDGSVRYSHVFPRHVEADQPRRLEPVLRSGALFVPQYRVHVVRPGDGEILGSVPTDLIPDLLRVDERCDVYVAEESGHIAGFGVAAKLTLVK
jgi:hypothetical protein